MRWIYKISINLYHYLILLASLWKPKAKQWIEGRKKWKSNLPQKNPTEKWLWFHCASLGEFEQGRPIIESIHTSFPQYKILLTFFSPSGYEIRKNYPLADHIMYLPLDTPANAKHFLEAFDFKLVVFVKYELWICFLEALFSNEIPVILISARMGENSPFFKSIFSPLYHRVFEKLDMIFTQDAITAQNISSFNPKARVQISSDTRYDRVLDHAKRFEAVPEILPFTTSEVILIAGSTWPRDEEVLFEAFQQLREEFPIKIIIAPHEINYQRINKWIKQFPEESLIFSHIQSVKKKHRILWIDNIGKLSRIYAYGHIAYVGGAWKQGLHNILEPSVFGLPVIFGPKYEKFPEAGELISMNCGFPVSSSQNLIDQLRKLMKDSELRERIKRKSMDYITQKSGATQQIITHCINQGYLKREV